ncbi:cysteine desulfurase family protein [Roseomonas elaeocarpi]|uniref:Cysteine desulfurase n=1 Tax=Roseomonas elaeocarpi TaxID=907779 RepID=A0ABV6JV00_9PROT
MTPLYLDANATEPLRPEARAAAIEAMDLVGNPSSVHAEGRAARRVLEAARRQLAARFDAAPADVIFTSGGTEADALAMAGLAVPQGAPGAVASDNAAQPGRRVLAGSTEHPAVLAAVPEEARLPVLPTGEIDLAALDAVLRDGPPALVCLMLANNETGVLNPVAEAAAICHRHGAILHVDATQAAGRIPVSLRALGADSLAVSGHKLGGPKGAGALILRPGLHLLPVTVGGGQERGRRGGTEALPAIAGLGAAALAADPAAATRLAALRDRIEALVLGNASGAGASADLIANRAGFAAGAAAPRLPNTTNLVLPGIPAETQVIALDLLGVRVSAGSACSSGKVARSAVLAAMGLGEAAGCAIRVSLPWNTPDDAPERFAQAYAAMRGTLSQRNEVRATSAA